MLEDGSKIITYSFLDSDTGERTFDIEYVYPNGFSKRLNTDGSEEAPTRRTADMYKDPEGNDIPTIEAFLQMLTAADEAERAAEDGEEATEIAAVAAEDPACKGGDCETGNEVKINIVFDVTIDNSGEDGPVISMAQAE